MISDFVRMATESPTDLIPPLVNPPYASGEVKTDQETHEDDADDDGVMIGVEIFEESDLDTDTENKLQLYADGGGGDSSDAVVANTTVVVAPESSSASSGAAVSRKEQREPSRLSLEDRVRCIRMCSNYNSYADVQKAWRQKFQTEPPCRRTLSTLNKKFQKTGSVADLMRTGRPKSTRTEATVAKVEEAVKKDPSKSIRSLAKELGINQASVHRIKKEFEDKRNTLKTENKKLKDKLNDALKRIIVLERRLTQNMDNNSAQAGVETLVFTSGDTAAGGAISTHLDGGQTGSNLPTIIALNSSSNNASIPSILRLQQSGQDVVHIITLPQASSHQLLSLDESSPIQLTLPNINIGQSQTSSF